MKFPSPQLRKSNRRLLVLMILFAIALTTLVLVWKWRLYEEEKRHTSTRSNLEVPVLKISRREVV
jgi:hypothetical protein